jgi:hypothetical protein
VVKARYVALIHQSLQQLESQADGGQKMGEIRDDVPAKELAMMLMCLVVGAQTLLELEVPMHAARLASALMLMMRRE